MAGFKTDTRDQKDMVKEKVLYSWQPEGEKGKDERLKYIFPGHIPSDPPLVNTHVLTAHSSFELISGLIHH